MNGSLGQDVGTVLVVEDDGTLVRVVIHGLRARGCDVIGVSTLAEALTVIREQSPSVMLVDIDLPDGSGWDAIRSAREIRGDEVKVIVMSALRPNANLIVELGCFGFLEKPFPIQALLRQVDASLGSQTAADADSAPWING